mgnify:CR=1 FL=1
MDSEKKYNSFFVKDSGQPNPLTVEGMEQFASPGSISNYHIGKNVIRADNLVIGAQSVSSNATWTPTANSLAWDTHSLILGDNRVISISAGSASITNPSLTYYIYYKDGASTYNVSTIRSDAVSAGRVLVNTARVDASGNVSFSTAFNEGTQISGNNIKTGKIQSNDGRTFFDLNLAKIQMSDASYPRVVIDGATPKLVISKPGFDANSATPAQSFLNISNSGSTQTLQATFSNGAGNQINNFNSSPGFVAYDGVVNYYTQILLYIPSNWTLTDAVLDIISNDASYDNGGGYTLTRNNDLSIRINPTKTTTGGGGSPYLWRFSAGTSIATGVVPSSDGYTQTYTFSTPQKAALTSGWNRITIQQDTNAPFNYGIIGMELVLSYFVTLT